MFMSALLLTNGGGRPFKPAGNSMSKAIDSEGDYRITLVVNGRTVVKQFRFKEDFIGFRDSYQFWMADRDKRGGLESMKCEVIRPENGKRRKEA